jgi:hypothetical protein
MPIVISQALQSLIVVKARLPVKRRVHLPRELLQLPPGARLKIGYKLYTADRRPRQIVGFLIPRSGLYDASGRLVRKLRIEDQIKNLDPFAQRPLKLEALKKKDWLVAAVLHGSEVRLAVEPGGNIVGILKSLEPGPAHL